jgi:hypothetical protein
VVSVVGAWTLVSYLDVDESGRTRGGPLGEDPYGLLIYSPTGHVSVSMMSSRDGPEAERYMGYAGRWRLDGGCVIHDVLVSSHPHLAGTRQVRDVVLDDDRLTLAGVSLLGGRPQRRVLTWRRV